MHRMQFIPWHQTNPDTDPLVRIPVTLVESESVDESADGRVELGDMRSVCVCACVRACVRVCVGVYKMALPSTNMGYFLCSILFPFI